MAIHLFTGSREQPNHPSMIVQVLQIFDTILAEESPRFFVGDCPRGLDLHVSEMWGEYVEAKTATGQAPERWPMMRVLRANWDKYGKQAGAIRNAVMVKEAKMLADYLALELHCHAWPLPQGSGTQDCIRHAKRVGATVTVYTKEEYV